MSVCVCPSKSDRHIRAYFFFLWGFGWFTLSSESPKVTLFMFSCSSAFWRCSIQSASCYTYLHFATSRRRIRWSFSFGCKGNSGICRKSKVKPPVLREKSPALRVVFFPKNLAFPNPYLDGATETKTTDATGRRIKKMSDNREADKKF